MLYQINQNTKGNFYSNIYRVFLGWCISGRGAKIKSRQNIKACSSIKPKVNTALLSAMPITYVLHLNCREAIKNKDEVVNCTRMSKS